MNMNWKNNLKEELLVSLMTSHPPPRILSPPSSPLESNDLLLTYKVQKSHSEARGRERLKADGNARIPHNFTSH